MTTLHLQVGKSYCTKSGDLVTIESFRILLLENGQQWGMFRSSEENYYSSNGAAMPVFAEGAPQDSGADLEYEYGSPPPIDGANDFLHLVNKIQMLGRLKGVNVTVNIGQFIPQLSSLNTL